MDLHVSDNQKCCAIQICTLYNIGKRRVIKWSRIHSEMLKFVEFARNGLLTLERIKFEAKRHISIGGHFRFLMAPLLSQA